MNYRKYVSNFLSTWLANWQWLFNGPIMARTQILEHTRVGAQNQDFGPVSQTDLTRSLDPFEVQASCKLVCLFVCLYFMSILICRLNFIWLHWSKTSLASMFCFVLFLGEFAHFSFYKLCVPIMHVKKTNLKGTVLWSIITWPTLGKQSTHAREVSLLNWIEEHKKNEWKAPFYLIVIIYLFSQQI